MNPKMTGEDLTVFHAEDHEVLLDGLRQAFQIEIDAYEFGAEDDEDEVRIITIHTTDCRLTQSDGEADCTCLPFGINVATLHRVGADAAARAVDPYVRGLLQGQQNVEDDPESEPPAE